MSLQDDRPSLVRLGPREGLGQYRRALCPNSRAYAHEESEMRQQGETLDRRVQRLPKGC